MKNKNREKYTVQTLEFNTVYLLLDQASSFLINTICGINFDYQTKHLSFKIT
jgi:hypothetical protein